MRPKGKMLIIGGAEYKGEWGATGVKHNDHEYNRLEILRELLPPTKNNKIELITSGTTIPNVVRRDYTSAFHKLGYVTPGFIYIKDKMEARDKAIQKRLEAATAVFFTGGDQFRLATIIGGTRVATIIKKRYHEDRNFLVAGTSAGAMVMSEVMITEGGIEEALKGRDLKISSGLGIVKDCIIDTHFIKRGRFGRLAHAVITNPNELGIGLGEDTALIIKRGSDAECRGSGMVIIIDGKHIKQTNIIEVAEDQPVYVENLRVHILVKGCRFSIKTRKLVYPTINPRQKKILREMEEEA